jgi:hypothetical protein
MRWPQNPVQDVNQMAESDDEMRTFKKNIFSEV